MKSELQKMLDGELYVASDAELVSLRSNARRLFSKYNQTSYDDSDTRTQILNELFG